MTRRLEVYAVAMLLSGLGATAAARTVVLTGEVRSVGAQEIRTPQANMSPVVIRHFVPEGQAVKKGDVVLRVDPGQSASQISELDAKIEQARATAAKELVELEVKAIDADIALSDAEAELATARIDAAAPRELISRLDYDRHQGALDKAQREIVLKRKELDLARAAVARRRRDGELEVERHLVQRDYQRILLTMSEVRADRDGIILHGFNNNWIGGRIDEGSSTLPGGKAGEVVSGGRMAVRAWALEPDRSGLRVGQVVQIAFDALPDQRVQGRIAAIAGAPDRKPEWGNGRYFSLEIELTSQPKALLPGMSARVIASTAATGAAR